MKSGALNQSLPNRQRRLRQTLHVVENISVSQKNEPTFIGKQESFTKTRHLLK